MKEAQLYIIDDMHRVHDVTIVLGVSLVRFVIESEANSFKRGDLNASKRFEFLQSRVTPRVSHASRARLATSHSDTALLFLRF